MARTSSNYTRSINDSGISYSLPNGKTMKVKWEDITTERGRELIAEGIHTLVQRRMVDKDWDEENITEALTLAVSGERKAREVSQASPLNVAAYILFRRYAALNANKEDPKVSTDAAAETLKEMGDVDFAKLKGNKIFQIAYRKAKADQAEKEAAEFEAQLLAKVEAAV